MDKDQIVEEFFRSLKVALTNAFAYNKDHPYFIKSVENFKLKLEALLVISNPFRIGVTSTGLVVDGKNLTKTGFYDELARLLHQRKIKSVEISGGSTLQELIQFLGVISLPQREFIKNGVLSALLEKARLIHFTIQELDYSAFLSGEGQECTDVWSYMLKEAVEGNDEVKINNLAHNLDKLLKGTNQNDIFETQEIPATINEFLVCLRNKDKEKFEKCSKDLFLWILHNKKSISKEKLVNLKQTFDSLNQEDFSTLFWEGLLHEDNFDALSLQVFSKISGQNNPAEIAQGVFNKNNASQRLNSNPRVAKRIQDLLTGIQDDKLSSVYRNTLESLIKGISSSGVLFFDQKALKENYRYIVLNMLSSDEDKDNLLLAAEVLERELASIFEDNDLGFLKDLWSQLVKRKKEGISVCVDLERKFSVFIENIILSQSLPPEQDCLLEMVSFPNQEMSFYLSIIFNAEKVNKLVLGLFFKFFPGNLDIFYQRVEEKLQDIEFLYSLIEALGQLAAPVTLGILDHIYYSANELIKVEILNIMRKLKKGDVEFLMRQLNTDSPALRKNLLSVLILDAQAGDGALDLLLKIPNFCGRKNALLIENMQIVFDLGLIETAGRIHDLSRRKFFWNRKLRVRAKQILKEWNAH